MSNNRGMSVAHLRRVVVGSILIALAVGSAAWRSPSSCNAIVATVGGTTREEVARGAPNEIEVGIFPAWELDSNLDYVLLRLEDERALRRPLARGNGVQAGPANCGQGTVLLEPFQPPRWASGKGRIDGPTEAPRVRASARGGEV